MYLKNILFLCATFYFFQCQGFGPSDYLIRCVERQVPELLGQGVIDLDKIKHVCGQFGDEHGEFLRTDRMIETIEKIELYKNDVQLFILTFVASSDKTTEQTINEIVQSHLQKVGDIDMRRLRDILIDVAEQGNPSNKYPRFTDTFKTIAQDILRESQRTEYNRLYTVDEVKTYALAVAASRDMNLVNDLNRAFVRFKNLKNYHSMEYEKFIEVIQKIIQDRSIKKPVPSYDEFEALVLARKFTVSGVENIIKQQLYAKYGL